MKTTLALVCVLAAAPVGADTLSDVKAAVGRLHAKESVRAVFSTEASVKAEGRFANDNTKRKAAVEVTQSPAGITITLPAAMLDEAAKIGDDVIGSIRTIDIAEALDFRRALLEILQHSTIVEEKRVRMNGRPARLLDLKVTQPPKKEANTIRIGSVKSDVSMKLWVGDDDLPIAADRSEKTSAGILMVRANSTSRTLYTFGHTADRLILARVETSDKGSAMGQAVQRNGVQTLTLQ